MDRGSEDFAAFYERHRGPCFRAVLATVADRRRPVPCVPQHESKQEALQDAAR